MTLVYSEEQQELRDAVRRLLADKAGSAELRTTIDSDDGYDHSLWSQMAEQIGLHGLAIPEEFGGAGFTFVELSIVFEEMGRALLAGPFFSSVGLAANLLLCSDDDAAKKDLLPGIAEGATIATAAFSGLDGSIALDDVALTAANVDGGWTVDGEAAYVTDGLVADLILVVAKSDGGLSLLAVDGTADGVTRVDMPALDLTRRLAKITFAGAPARLIGTAGSAAAGVQAGLDRATACLAAEQVGAAQFCLDQAVAYSKVRVQFERPIGSFQVIKHRAADMLMKVETARSAAMYAASAIGDDLADEIDLAVAIAGAFCPDAFFDVAADNIQIHGGIGYTWEHDAHLYFRRAKSGQLLFGTPNSFRDRVADLGGY
jgi:alkylation response protein AidB-like acyl-CoA dehydrogenase